MKKVCISLFMFLILALCMPTKVLAAKKHNKNISGISAYYSENQLHTFVQLKNGYNGTNTKAVQMSDDTIISEKATPVFLTESKSSVRYLLMVDLSGSVKEHIDEINVFTESLMNSVKQDSLFSVASFGENFKLVAENFTDKKAVSDTLRGLEYSEQLTDPYTGIINALKYLDNCPRRSGDIVNLIVISDGQPDLGYKDKEKEKAAEKKLASKVAKLIKHTPEVVVHTLVFSQKKSTAFNSISVGTGISQVVKNNKSSKRTGKKIASFINRLYKVTFSLQEITKKDGMPVKLLFQKYNSEDGNIDMCTVSWNYVPILKTFFSKDIPNKDDPSSSSESKGDDDKKQDNIEDEKAVENDKSIVSDKYSKFLIFIKDNKVWLFVIIIAAVVLIICIIFIVVLKKKAAKKQKVENIQNAICMKLQVISGKCKTSKMEFYLTNQIIIGSDSKCDLVWKDTGVSACNSRIFIQNNEIYIEDLNSTNGTVLNGMRLHAANRLRSGDEITVGTSRFVLWF